MKKLIFIFTNALLVTGSAFAQGAVNWGAISFANFTAQTNTTVLSPFLGHFSGTLTEGTVGAAGGSAPAGTGFYYELLVGAVWAGSAQAAPTTFAAFSSWTDSGLSASNSVTAGRVVVISPNSATTVNVMSSSVSNNIILVGWSANLGSTWPTALNNLENGNWTGNAFFGISSVGFIEAAPLPSSQGNNLFGSAAQSYGTPIQSLNTQLYLLVNVPEPGTLALTAFGGASLLLFRRKK